MFGLSATEIVVILVVALLVFGPTRLPGIARRLGRTLGEFRRAAQDLKDGFAGDLMKASPGSPAAHPASEDKGSPAQASASASQGESAAGDNASASASEPASAEASNASGESKAAPGGEERA